MPTLDPRVRYPSENNRIAIPTLSGGVGRQAPSKRAVNEAENLDNILVTLERSAEKRAGSNFIHRYTGPVFDTLSTTPNDSSLKLHDLSLTADYKFFWFQISEEQRYLVAINFASTSTSEYIQIFRATKTGFYECTIEDHNTQALLDYFTYDGGDTALKGDDTLSSITIGPQMLFNNNQVYAGYTSKPFTVTTSLISANQITFDGTAVNTYSNGDIVWCKIGLDGEFLTTGSAPNLTYQEDIKGRKLVYYTTTPVDPEGTASIYVDGKFYIKNNQVFHSMPHGTDLAPWLKKRYNASGSLDFATITVHSSFAYQWDTLEADIPLDLIDFHVKAIQVIDGSKKPTPGADELKLTFHQESGRNRFEELDKFFLDSIDIPLDNTEYVKTDNGSTEWYITWTSAATSETTDLSDNFQTTWTSTTTVQSEAYSFRGLVTDYTMPPSLAPYLSGTTIDLGTVDVSSIVLTFNCIDDGTAEDSSWPTYSSDSGTDAASFTLRSDSDGGPIAKHIPVEDWRYPDSTKRYLGHKLADFSEFKFPPKAGNSSSDNDGSSSADSDNFNLPPTDMHGKVGPTLLSLYSDINATGKGKINYVENSYAGEVPGFYIFKDEANSPYVRLIRTPYEYSVLDEDRFPKILKIKTASTGSTPEVFTVINLSLEERRSGNLNTNPGPEAFKDGLQRPLNSMAFFRDRLFLSAADTVFSSRTGDFSDFWTENPSIITDTDPIDVRLSTNKYAEVKTMTPFSSSMFINTGSDIQFTLKGSENSITPFTAEVSPSSFYSTAPLINPVLLGSQIYFFAPKRAYVFFNDATVSINQAIEVSLACPNYLPNSYGDVAVVPGYDSLCMIDKDNPKFLYMYTNRYQGADVVQNAFYRYIYDNDLVSVSSYDNDIYLVSRQLVVGSPNTYKYFLEYQSYFENDHSVPRLDHQVLLAESDSTLGSVTYNGSLDQTTITLNNYGNSNPDTLYIATSTAFETRAGEVIRLAANRDAVVVSLTNTSGNWVIILKGDFTTAGDIRKFIVGTSYTSTIQLSPQYLRDEGSNVVEGVLSLRTLHLQHHNTGSYRIEKSIRGRRKTQQVFSPAETDETAIITSDDGSTSVFTGDPNDLPMPLYEKLGESFTKIMGFASETDIFVVSDYPNPMNITQIELKGRFTAKTSGFVR